MAAEANSPNVRALRRIGRPESALSARSKTLRPQCRLDRRIPDVNITA
jgi:hypothetical protein